MSRRNVALLIALAVVAGAAVAFVATRPGASEPTRTAGASLGIEGDPGVALWTRLTKLRAWLPTFDEAFKDSAPEPRTVLAAFATVAEKVAGPAGFWRDTVPNELLECHKEPEQGVCRRLSESLPELSDGEALARSIGRLDESRAGVFLERNAEAMSAWLASFAPSEPTEAAMKTTAFWEQKLAPAVAGQ